jgi:hypothetical protein
MDIVDTVKAVRTRIPRRLNNIYVCTVARLMLRVLFIVCEKYLHRCPQDKCSRCRDVTVHYFAHFDHNFATNYAFVWQYVVTAVHYACQEAEQI